MGYGKQWKVSKATLESLIANADSNDICFIEVWNDTDDVIENSGTELWLKLSTGWSDEHPIIPPVSPT